MNSLDALLPWALSVALLTVRLTVAFALSPPLSAFRIPAAVRMALVMALALMASSQPGIAAVARSMAADPLLMLGPIGSEVLTGALLGLGVHVVFAALSLAGRLLDVQVGFGIASVFDPVTRASANVLGMMFSLIGVMFFFVSDAHLMLVHLVFRSVEVFPLGQLPVVSDPMRLLLATGSMFGLGLAFAAPVAAALFLADLAVGAVSRNMPQLNVLVLAIPVKVIVAYGVLALSVKGWAPLLNDGFARTAVILGAQ